MAAQRSLGLELWPGDLPVTPERFSVSDVEGNHLSLIWAGWGKRGLQKTANRHCENFLFAFLKEKKKCFWDAFFILFQANILKIFFFSDSSSPNPIMDYGKYYLTFHLYLKIKMKKKIWRRKHSSWYDRAIREKCQLADAVFLDYEMATHISWNKKENENTGCLACLSVISYIRKVADHLEDGVIFPSILVFYESKACLGGKQLSSGELTNYKCQILLQEIRKAVKL